MILKKILNHKTLELEARRRKISRRDIEKMAMDTEMPTPFLSRFQENMNIIAEIKKASPSAGVFFVDYKPEEIALAYAKNGAAALSILTDENFFQGCDADIEKVRQHLIHRLEFCPPILRKDFIISDYQIFESRKIGANAILLIARILDKFQLKDFLAMASETGLKCLIEIHDAEDLQRVLPLEAELLGINNRDLDSLQTSLDTSFKLKKEADDFFKTFPSFKKPTWISESGLKSHDDLKKLTEQGFHGFLIGETFLKNENPGLALQELKCKKISSD